VKQGLVYVPEERLAVFEKHFKEVHPESVIKIATPKKKNTIHETLHKCVHLHTQHLQLVQALELNDHTD
jgi:hypothetical protein